MWSTWMYLSVIWNFQSHFPLKCLLFLLLCVKQTKLIYIAGSDFPRLFWLSQATCTGVKYQPFRGGRWAQPHAPHKHQYKSLETGTAAIFFFPHLHSPHSEQRHKEKKKKNPNKWNNTFEVPRISYSHCCISTLGNTQYSIVYRLEQAGLCGYKIILEYHPHSPILLPCLERENLFLLHHQPKQQVTQK